MKRSMNFVVLVLVGCFLLAGCSGGGGGGGVLLPAQEKIQLSGSIAPEGGYSFKATPTIFGKALSVLGLNTLAYAAMGDPVVDQIVAIPMERGSLTAWSMQNSKRATISDDGSFSLSITKNMDWLLVLIDSSVTGTNRFVGSIAMNTATADSLLNIPATTADISSMNLGTISRQEGSDDAITSASANESDFNMTAEQLQTLAKNDDLFKNAMNIVNNYGAFGNAATEWYQLRPDFHWLGNYATLSDYSDPEVMDYNGMNFQLDTNTTDVSMDDVCGIPSHVALHPPTSVTMGAKTYDYANPITNSGTGCALWNEGPAKETTDSDLYACNAYGGKISYSVLASFMSGSIPTGFWEWKEDGVPKAAFEIGNINPPVTATGKLKGFMPSFKVNVDAATKKIQSVDIRWYYLEGSNYVLLTDLTVLKHFIQSAEVKFDVGMGGSRKTCEMYFDPATTTNLVPSNFATTNCNEDWYYGNSSFPDTDTGLMGFYESGGFGYFFDFFKPM